MGVAAVSWAAPLIRLAEAPALTIAALRLTIASVPLGGALLLRRRDELRALARTDALLLLLAGFALALHFAFWVASVQRTSIVASVVLVATQPLFVGLGAWVALGERPSRALLVGLAIATAGMLLLVGADLGDRGSLTGDALAIAGAVFASVYLVIGRGVRHRVSNLAFVGIVDIAAAVVLLGMLLIEGSAVRGLPREAYLYILALALVPQLIGHSALTWALGYVPAALVAVAILGEPAGATAIAAVVVGERPTLLQWAGALVVLAGVYVALRAPGEAITPAGDAIARGEGAG